MVTIYAEKDECIKVRPQELENITLSPQNSSSIYEALIAKRKHNTKKLRFSPEPEKPIDIAAPKEQLDENIKHLTSKFSQETNLANVGITLDKRKHGKSNVDKAALNIIKVTKENSHLISPQNDNGSNDGYMVQLASVKSAHAAMQEGERIKRRFSKILANANITAKQVMHDNGKFFYLVLAGNFKTISEAKAICKKLSSQQQSCVLK